MSFIDLVLNRLGGGGKPRDVQLGQVVKIIRDSVEVQIAPIYPACEKSCSAILSEVEEARKAAKVMSEKELDSSKPQYRIGLQMQKNFAERIPATFNEVVMPTTKDYASFAGFHAASSRMITAVAQISNDNRYLPFFFDEEIGAFGTQMNEIIRLTGELGAALDSRKEPASQLNRAQQLEKEIAANKQELASLIELKKDIAGRKSALDAELLSATAKNKELAQDQTRIKQEVSGIKDRISENRKRITDLLSPFQRQFRKMQKLIAEKGDSRKLNEYVDAAEDALIGEVVQHEDYPSLRRVLDRMRKALEKGELEDDEKVRSRRLELIDEILGDGLTAPAKNLIALEKDLKSREEALRAVLQKMSNLDIIKNQIDQNAEQTAKLEKHAAEAGDKLENSVLELESLVKKATGKSVKIMRD